MKRYSILAVHYGSSQEIEVCQCDSNPKAVAEGVMEKVLWITNNDGRRVSIPRWQGVRIVENGDG